MSAREGSAAFLKEKYKHKREREPSERIAAACAELRRAIPKEIEWLEHDMTGLPEVSTYEQEIRSLSSLLDATNINIDLLGLSMRRLIQENMTPTQLDSFSSRMS